MNTDRLVLGVLDNSADIGDPRLAAKYRNLTLSWSRFGYRDVLIEGQSVDAILAEAESLGFRFCLVQPYGHVIQERWIPTNSLSPDFFSALDASIQESDFLIMGQIADGGPHWFGFEPTCLLVNLEKYRQLGCPRFDSGSGEARELPEAVVDVEQGRFKVLRGGSKTVVRQPCLSGWQLILASLQAGLPVSEFRDEILHYSLQLPIKPGDRDTMARFLHEGIEQFGVDRCPAGLGHGVGEFLQAVKAQTSHARRGVFLWNIESYQDVESPPPGFCPPISTLYSVAAGFKPNRILHSHGFAPDTRIVYFDYSPNALAVKKHLVDQWEERISPISSASCSKNSRILTHSINFGMDRTPDDVDWKTSRTSGVVS